MANSDATFDMLLKALQDPLDFPRSCFGRDTQVIRHNILADQLTRRADALFDANAAVEFFECYRKERRNVEDEQYTASKPFAMYHTITLTNSNDLMQHLLDRPQAQDRPDPQHRFIFIGAPHSRAPLKITRMMMAQAFMYHQVMPDFLHYVLPFGNQHYVRDYHSIGFRSESRLLNPNHALRILRLGRSGRHIELCYGMKSVEQASSSQDHWSIRQCSLYHRLDIDTEQMIWIVIKANKTIRNAIEQYALQGESHPLVLAIGVHRIVAEWAAANWHWYLNDLEAQLQAKMRRSLMSPLKRPPVQDRAKISHTVPCHAAATDYHKKWFDGSLLQFFGRTMSNLWNTSSPSPVSRYVCPLHQVSEAPMVLSSAIDSLTFEDLQDVYYLEKKTNEVLITLKSNSKVLSELKREYGEMTLPYDCSPGLLDEYRTFTTQLVQRLEDLITEFAMQQDRTEGLLRDLSEQKGLIQNILQYRNLEASRISSERAQACAENTETLARQTKTETVSMRIITVVTLFFLPGTFISTLMSTPMVRFEDTSPGFSTSNIGVGALELFLTISIPLVCIAFVAWYCLHRFERRKEEKRKAWQTKVSDAVDSPV